MGLPIIGFRTLYEIYKRHVERENDILAQRKQLASELYETSATWTTLLIETFDEAIALWENEGKEVAILAVEGLMNDFSKLDYYSLRDTSPILNFLDEDKPFQEFVYACRQYYQSALGIKRLVYGGIKNHEGQYVSMQNAEIRDIITLYSEELELMHRRITDAHNAIKTVLPK